MFTKPHEMKKSVGRGCPDSRASSLQGRGSNPLSLRENPHEIEKEILIHGVGQSERLLGSTNNNTEDHKLE